MEATIHDYEQAHNELEKLLADEGITAESVFVPFRESRNAEEKAYSLNWKSTIKVGKWAILTIDYMQGIAHVPGYQPPMGHHNLEHNKIEAKAAISGVGPKGKIPPPSAVDVVSAVAMDSDTLNHASFESWAGECGYDEDSRSAEKVYRQCLEHALAMRNALGNDLLERIMDLSHQL